MSALLSVCPPVCFHLCVCAPRALTCVLSWYSVLFAIPPITLGVCCRDNFPLSMLGITKKSPSNSSQPPFLLFSHCLPMASAIYAFFSLGAQGLLSARRTQQLVLLGSWKCYLVPRYPPFCDFWWFNGLILTSGDFMGILTVIHGDVMYWWWSIVIYGAQWCTEFFNFWTFGRPVQATFAIPLMWGKEEDEVVGWAFQTWQERHGLEKS